MAHAAHDAGLPARRVLGHLAWMVAITLAVLAGAAAMSWSRSPVYRATADVLVTAPAASNLAPDMGTERTVASSLAVLDRAAATLGLTAEDLGGGLSVTVPVDTHVLRIASTRAAPLDAQRRAQAVADAYVAYRSAQTARIITPALAPRTPASPNHAVDLSVALLVGLSLAVGVALLRHRFDDRLRGAADLERYAGVPVLARIPAFRGTGRDPPVDWPSCTVPSPAPPTPTGNCAPGCCAPCRTSATGPERQCWSPARGTRTGAPSPRTSPPRWRSAAGG